MGWITPQQLDKMQEQREKTQYMPAFEPTVARHSGEMAISGKEQLKLIKEQMLQRAKFKKKEYTTFKWVNDYTDNTKLNYMARATGQLKKEGKLDAIRDGSEKIYFTKEQ